MKQKLFFAEPSAEKGAQSFIMQTIDFNNDKASIKSADNVHKTCFQNAIDYFHEYCNCSSIHGFRYFGERRTICEKIWWFVVFILCIISLSFAIRAVYKKWDSSPVIVSFSTKGVPIYSIPFPAITICSEEKIRQSVFNYTQALIAKRNGEILNQTDENIFGQFHYICDKGEEVESNHTDAENIFQTLENISPQFKFVDCSILGSEINCDEYITPIITDEGLCYTFNMISRTELLSDAVLHYSIYHDINQTARDWTEDGYKEETPVDTYPYRALLPGARYGFSFTIKSVEEPFDSHCTTSLRGFKILFHSPLRMPRLNLEYSRVDLDNSATIIVSPSIISTSAAVKAYNPQKRKCFFQSERKLQYFKFYSSSNCKLECITNATLQLCGCVIFYMPRENGTRICAGADFRCTINAEYTMHIVELSNQFQHTNLEINSTTIKDVQYCNCLPLCSDIDYSISMSQTTWDWSLERKNALNESSNDSIYNSHFTRFSIYFSKSDFRSSERNELYGPTDFLANFGGLLGLFTGFSILSFMEIIYFLTLRVVANKKLFNHWVGAAK